MKNQLAVISALLLGFMPIAALADVTAEPLSGVTIEDASATTAGQGETSQVRFRISNSGVDDIALIGISSDVSESGAIVIDDPLSGDRDIEMLTVLREEELDLTTSHIRGELRNVTEPFVEGEFVAFNLVFRSGTVSAEAHIHRP